MSDYTTGTDPDGYERRRPFNEHAGEVTRRKKGKDTAGGEDAVEKPPAFTGKKIGGAKNMLRKYVNTLKAGASDDTSSAQDSLLEAGVRINDLSSEPVKRKTTVESLAAPVGKRRIWHTVDLQKKATLSELPGVWVSTTCRSCLIHNDKCSGWEIEDIEGQFKVSERQIRCRRCISEGRMCHRMVEYTPGASDDESSKTSHDSDSLEEVWQARIGTALEIASRSENGSVMLASRPSVDRTSASSPSKSQEQVDGKSGPTYSRVRDAYKWLAEQRYHDQCFGRDSRPPLRDFWLPYSDNTKRIETSTHYRVLSPESSTYSISQNPAAPADESYQCHWGNQYTLCLRKNGKCLQLHTRGHIFAEPPPHYQWYSSNDECKPLMPSQGYHAQDVKARNRCLRHGAWCLGIHDARASEYMTPDEFAWVDQERECTRHDAFTRDDLASDRVLPGYQDIWDQRLDIYLNSWLKAHIELDATGLVKFRSLVDGRDLVGLHQLRNCLDLDPVFSLVSKWQNAEKEYSELLIDGKVKIQHQVLAQPMAIDVFDKSEVDCKALRLECLQMAQEEANEILLGLQVAYRDATGLLDQCDMQSIRRMLKAREDYLEGLMERNKICRQAIVAFTARQRRLLMESRNEAKFHVFRELEFVQVLQRKRHLAITTLQSHHDSESERVWILRSQRECLLRDMIERGSVDVEAFWRLRRTQQDAYVRGMNGSRDVHLISDLYVED